MLRPHLVANVLEQSLAQSAVIACAVISMEGVVLESREKMNTKDTEVNGDDFDLDYRISPKLQVKISSIFAAEYWKRCDDALWLGAETRDKRLLVTPIEGVSLLLLMIGKMDQSWGLLSREAIEAAGKLH